MGPVPLGPSRTCHRNRVLLVATLFGFFAFLYFVSVSSILPKHSTATFTTELIKATNDEPSVELASNSQQKIVLLVGPHKTASTSVQYHLTQLYKAGILQQHDWSWVAPPTAKAFSLPIRWLLLSASSSLSTKNHTSRFLDSDDGVAQSTPPKIVLELKSKMQEELKNGNSLVIAAEFLDYAAALPGAEARRALKSLWEWLLKVNLSMEDATGTLLPEIQVVVMYRKPRMSHLISIWKEAVTVRNEAKFKQDRLPWRKAWDSGNSATESGTSAVATARKHPPTFTEWLCTGEWKDVFKYDLASILSAQLNPFGIAHAYLAYTPSSRPPEVVLMDMDEVMSSSIYKGDVPNAVVCDILQLPCEKGRPRKIVEYHNLNGDGSETAKIESVVTVKNRKPQPASLGFTDETLAFQEMEAIIKGMDCYYYNLVKEKLKVLYGENGPLIDSKQGGRYGCQASFTPLESRIAVERLRQAACKWSLPMNERMFRNTGHENKP